MKRALAMLVLVCLCICATVSGCTYRNTPKEDEYYERICVDIATKDGGFYSTFSDVTIIYYDNVAYNVRISDPTLLAFKVSDTYDGGVCLIDGAEIEQVIQQLTDAKSALDEMDTETASDYIEIILELLRSKAVYDYCPT